MPPYLRWHYADNDAILVGWELPEAQRRIRGRADAHRQIDRGPAVRALGERIEVRFRDAAYAAVQKALAAGVPVAVLTEADQVGWLHPDGVIRRSGITTTPESAPASI